MKWEDARSIVNIADDLFENSGWEFDNEQEYYEEVVRRFQQVKKDAGKPAVNKMQSNRA